jgi:hypothetical protein
MGRGDFAAILQKNLDEEKGADKKLSVIAESRVNRKAGGHAPPARAKKSLAPQRRRAGGRRRAA